MTIITKVVSTHPLGVGTSLALETLSVGDLPSLDPSRKPPMDIDITAYNSLWINVSCLFRNMYQAYKQDEIKMVGFNRLAIGLVEEMRYITQLFSGRLDVVFYHCTYTHLHKINNPIVNLRKKTTEKQLYEISAFNEALKRIKLEQIKMSEFDSTLKPLKGTRALVMTNAPYDLLSHDKFEVMHLLESHTGLVKPKLVWATKFYKAKEKGLVNLPFIKHFLFIFGDNEHFSPSFRAQLQDVLMALSKKCKWHNSTTLEKILFDVDLNINDLFFKESFKKLGSI